MKRLLYILLCLQIISGVYLFFLFLGNNAFAAVVAGFISILQIVLTLSVIRNTDETERLSEETFWLRTKLKELEGVWSIPIIRRSLPYLRHTMAKPPAALWECVKCGTVNKAGTDACQNCDAAYSAEINPTSNPFAKKGNRVSADS